MAGKFFADMDAWVLEKTMQESPNRPLYEQWVEQGHLHVCPGEVFDSTYAINRLGEIVQQGINIIMFGFDPAQNAQPINQLKAWLQTLFQNRPDIGPKDMAAIIQQMVVPVPQTAMTQNPRIGELEHMILEQEPWLNFSQNPMWPWEFGNTAAMVNTSDLRRLVKGGPAPSHKMDNVAALVDALYCFDLTEGRVTE
jgi:phage terminase large subunit-like protein